MRQMNTFFNLPPEQKDQFSAACFELGFMCELNPKRYNEFLKNKVKNPSTPTKLKRMYKFMLRLDTVDRDRFFKAFTS